MVLPRVGPSRSSSISVRNEERGRITGGGDHRTSLPRRSPVNQRRSRSGRSRLRISLATRSASRSSSSLKNMLTACHERGPVRMTIRAWPRIGCDRETRRTLSCGHDRVPDRGRNPEPSRTITTRRSVTIRLAPTPVSRATGSSSASSQSPRWAAEPSSPIEPVMSDRTGPQVLNCDTASIISRPGNREQPGGRARSTRRRPDKMPMAPSQARNPRQTTW